MLACGYSMWGAFTGTRFEHCWAGVGAGPSWQESKKEHKTALKQAVKGAAQRFTIARLQENETFGDVARAALQDIIARAESDAQVGIAALVFGGWVYLCGCSLGVARGT